jgi:hypothetical protein
MQCKVYEVMYYGTICIVLCNAKSKSTPKLNTTVRALVGFASKKTRMVQVQARLFKARTKTNPLHLTELLHFTTGFTSTVQERLFKSRDVSTWNQMLYVGHVSTPPPSVLSVFGFIMSSEKPISPSMYYFSSLYM